MRETRSFSLLLLASLTLSLTPWMAGCGEDAAGSVVLPYEEGVTVLRTGAGAETVATPSGSDCVELPGGACVSPQDTCGSNGHAEILVDGDGGLIDILCFPTTADRPTVGHVEGSVKPEQDGQVIVLDDVDDGADITNNVELGGDDVLMYGQGDAVSVIAGNLKVTGDRVVVRGVTIQGEVDLEGRENVLLDCVIHGNLHIQGDDAIVNNCTIFGDVSVDSVRGHMIDNLAQRRWRVRYATTDCAGNQAFEDDNENLIVEASELGDALTCPAE